MDKENLYNSPDVANVIKKYAQMKKISLKEILINCQLGSNTFSHMLHGKSIAFDSLARIADYLDVSVDYLLGRTDVVEVNRGYYYPEEIAAYGADGTRSKYVAPPKETT